MVRTRPHPPDRPAFRPDLLQELVEPTATILWALLLVGSPLPAQELADLCGRSRSEVQAALSQLASLGLIYNLGRDRWSLAADFRQLIAAVARQHPETLIESSDLLARTNGQRLEQILDHIGISPPALDWLLKRPDLQADPAPALAWWWFYLTQEWPTNGAGLVIKRLDEKRPPPAGFLTLAQIWPTVRATDRAEMEQMVWHTYSAGQLARAFAAAYPLFSEEAFVAFLALYQAAPDELGF